ncbi:MAG TPA: protein kinase [Verrucomicrobiae bacterium]|nr:protein kinase [Verrucomicrobiae bacterium]
MTRTREREEALFDAARRLDSIGSQRAFLDQACLGDDALRKRIDSLLEAAAAANAFFDDAAPVAESAAAVSKTSADGLGESRVSEGPGSRIGRYKLLQRIGEGGCGVVYMAEQEVPVRRRVALKIIKLGMDTKSVIARFEAERQALALMDHPNIARVLDAGATETGRPYFVMELVRGLKITDYCNQAHQDTSQRLHLFIQICQAIQHAHQKGIIHRDIKPSNVLVTLHDGVPVPKVIDFGIAKATEMRLTDKTLFTAYEQFIGTPAYMSPEQAEMSGLDIDTRSDIYSLGVLLYELLTGKTPFDPAKLMQSGFDEMRRTLREREPQRPSTMVTTMQGQELLTTARERQAEPPKLISLLKGDLDWIVMKALEKDRSRRYETANGLAMDIQRYLQHEPVAARPPSRLYRFQKLVRRNKVVCGAAAAVAAALIAGFSTSLILFLKEREARRIAVEAEQRAERARVTETLARRQAEAREKITQAAALMGKDRFAEADRVIAEIPLTPVTMEGASVFRALAEWHAMKGDWRNAAQRYTVLLQVNQLDGWDVSTLDYLGCGSALVELKDTAAYNRFRMGAIERFGGTASAVAAERILKISLLFPPDDVVMSALEPLADFADRTFSNSEMRTYEDSFRTAWASVSLGLFEYRRGNFARAEKWCLKALACSDHNEVRSATARALLVLLRHRAGQHESAQAEFSNAERIISTRFESSLDAGSRDEGFWFDWLFARDLLREAHSMLQKPSAALEPRVSAE